MKEVFILKNRNSNEVLLVSPKYDVLSEVLGKAVKILFEKLEQDKERILNK